MADARRRMLDTDLVYAGVQPVAGRPPGRELLLSRIDDDGLVHQVQV